MFGGFFIECPAEKKMESHTYIEVNFPSVKQEPQISSTSSSTSIESTNPLPLTEPEKVEKKKKYKCICVNCKDKSQGFNRTSEHICHIPDCKKVFKRVHHLRNHLRAHAGEREFKCEFCNARFVRCDDISRHKRIHTNDRKFKCEFCEKAFNRKDHLNKHELTHAKRSYRKPYKSRTARNFLVEVPQAELSSYQQEEYASHSDVQYTLDYTNCYPTQHQLYGLPSQQQQYNLSEFTIYPPDDHQDHSTYILPDVEFNTRIPAHPQSFEDSIMQDVWDLIEIDQKPTEPMDPVEFCLTSLGGSTLLPL